jgi:riboflavin kinase/FMN adenylyltransferase
MQVVSGVEALRPEHGPIFAVIGVFDGLHRGHAYLLGHLVREAAARDAKPTVITFDHHPDEVLTGSAPPLLLHPDERLERLAEAGVEVTVVQHFDEAVRRTTYDAFIDTIRRGTTLAGLLMTPDAAFGFERRGTAEAVTALGRERGFDVVVVPPFTVEGAAVSSSEIRAAIQRGDLATAERLLGRPVGLRGAASDGRITFEWPMALPPDGRYSCRIDGRPGTATVDDGTVRLGLASLDDPMPADGSIRVELAT